MTTTLPSRIARTLQPWMGRDPFLSLRDEMDSLLSRFSAEMDGEWVAGVLNPSLDLSETPEAVQARMDLPGLKPEDVNIEIVGNTLRISGERKEEKEEKNETYHRVERRSGSFSRSVTLPCAVKEGEVTAEYANGVLTVTMPKSEQAKSHKIKVKAK